MKRTALPLLAACVFATLPLAAQREPMPNPDFTQGESIPEGANHTWNLGPTGLRGWMHSHELETIQARQIAVTEVAEGSPADGVMRKGDVILGVFGQEFSHDPRQEFGRAITRAEADDGQLRLLVWRDGRTSPVTIRLSRLGSYSATAPFDCRKSERIFDKTAEALAERMQEDDYDDSVNAITRSLNALALLASGDESYLPLVQREAEWASNFSSDSFQVWWYAYVIMLLAEYQVATGDDSFHEGLRRLAMESAEGQSIVGSWGHRFAGEDGRLVGYGMMNAPGVPLTTSLIMGRIAGLDDPVVDRAIKRSAKLIRFYSGKGAVPYGDHNPWTQTHEDNGKNGMAAVMFNFLGEEEHAEYFARTSVAAHNFERDTGHTGNFTNILWAMPSVALSGPQATGGWMREFGSWYYDLARTWDFRFPHPGPPQRNFDSYRNWDTTGSFLLAYAMPRQEILLTGKQPTIVPQLDEQATESILRAGRGWSRNDRHSAYDSLTEDQLLEQLASWAPAVRQRAAIALSRRDDDLPIPALIEMLQSSDLHARYGAAEALKRARGKAAPAVDALKAQLDHEDMWARVTAADALAHIGGPARSALHVLLKRITVGPTEDDPRGMEQRFLMMAVFNQMLRNSIEGVDHELLFEAITASLQNQDGRARGSVAHIYNQLSDEAIEPLLPVIHEAVATPAPSGIMFADGIRLAGLDVLAEQRISEGMQLAIDIMDIDRWNKRYRMNRLFEILAAYEGAAKPLLPQLRQLKSDLNDHWEAEGLAPQIERLGELIESIESAEDAPELRQLHTENR